MSTTPQHYVRCLHAGEVREGSLAGEFVHIGVHKVSVHDVTLLAPCTPTKIIGVGRNYAEHAAEMNNPLPQQPLLFFKPPSALNHHNGPIVYPALTSELHYEGELAVVIGRRCRNVPRADALGVVAGYTLCNDVTARDLQRSDGQWTRAKGCDSFAPLGPCLVAGLDPSTLRLRTYHNGVLRQDARTSDLIFDIPFLIEYISAAFTLEAGDVITTGTPKGVGPIRPGDVIEVQMDEIGVLRNPVVAG